MYPSLHMPLSRIRAIARSRVVLLSLCACTTFGFAGTAFAIEVKESASFNADAEMVWKDIGPYCAIADWFPGIAKCELEVIDGVTNRRLHTADGNEFLEKQLASDDAAMSYSYAIMEGPLPVKNYESTFSDRQSGNETVLTWSSTFEAKGVADEDATKVIRGIYVTGLEAVKKRYAK